MGFPSLIFFSMVLGSKLGDLCRVAQHTPLNSPAAIVLRLPGLLAKDITARLFLEYQSSRIAQGWEGSWDLHLSIQPLLPTRCMKFCSNCTWLQGLWEGLYSEDVSGEGLGGGSPAQPVESHHPHWS